MSEITIVIPARNEPYLCQTVDDVFKNIRGDTDVMVVLDGYVEPNLGERDRLKIVHHEEPWGTRKTMNQAASLADSRYLMKVDAHCCFSEGFDEVLKRDHQYEWVVTLPRYSFKPETWTVGYGPIEYEYIAYPFERGRHIGGLTPNKWYGKEGNSDSRSNPDYFYMERLRKDIRIDEIQTCNGACWFLEKKRFLEFGGMDESCWNFHIDAVELGFKVWLSGGQLMINKNAWHGHWWKSEKKGDRKDTPLDWEAMRKTQAYSTWYWTHDKWPKTTRSFKWFVDHFWPIPGWPDNWEADVKMLDEAAISNAAVNNWKHGKNRDEVRATP